MRARLTAGLLLVSLITTLSFVARSAHHLPQAIHQQPGPAAFRNRTLRSSAPQGSPLSTVSPLSAAARFTDHVGRNTTPGVVRDLTSAAEVAGVLAQRMEKVDLLAGYSALMASLATGSEAPKCRGGDGKRLTRIAYTHRKPRAGELDTRAFMARVAVDEDVERMLYFDLPEVLPDMGYPDVIGPSPVNYHPSLSVTRPFGKWNAKFLQGPVSSLNLSVVSGPQVIRWQPPAYVAVFRDAWASQGNAMLCDRTYSTGACMWDAPHGTPEKYQTHDVGVVVCDSWCGGYFHWTHEHLPRVALVAAYLRQNRSMKLVLPVKAGFQREFLRILGVESSQVLSPGNHRFRRLLFPQPQRCGNVFSSTLFILRRLVFESLALQSAFAARPAAVQVVLAERKKGSRMPTNYGDLKASLIRQYSNVSFSVHLGKSVVDQIRMFNAAWIVFGPHGANLANILFMRMGGSHVIEMLPHSKANLCYYATCVRLGLMYHMIPFAGSTYTVNMSEVARHFDDALRA